MKAYVLDGIEKLELRETDRPDPGPGDVLLRVHTAGICGSDIEYYLHNRVGDFVPKGPLVLGHELAGEVVAHGGSVSAPPVGARVAIDPSIPCRRCRYCRVGRHNLCENMRFIGTAATYPHISGGLGEYVAVPAENCYIVGEHLSWGEGACLEPLAVAIHAALRPGSIAGARVLVSGGGTIGQFVALVVRALGAATIAVSDLQPFRRDFAVAQGAEYGLDPTDADAMAEAQREAGGFDLLFDASGAPAAVRANLELVDRGGTIVQVGTIQKPIELPANLIMSKELRILGSFRYGDVYATAMGLLSSRRTDVRPLVSATYAFDRVPQAFELAARRGETVKVQVAVSD